MAQPAAQIYNQPGDYIVEYFAVQTNATYFLESIEVVSNCADGGLYGDPDFFYTVSSPAGVLEIQIITILLKISIINQQF